MNLVNELQESAIKDDVLTVLRKTKRLASKLGLSDIVNWLKFEQNGYPDNDSVPSYRRVNSTVACNINDYIPIGFGMIVRGVVDLPSGDLDLNIPLRDSINVILSVIQLVYDGNEHCISIEKEFEYSLRQLYKFDPSVSQQVSLLLRPNRSQVEAIPNLIKDKVLDWACNLESAGILGEGLTFSTQDKEAAHNITLNIENSKIDQLNNLGTNQKGMP